MAVKNLGVLPAPATEHRHSRVFRAALSERLGIDQFPIGAFFRAFFDPRQFAAIRQWASSWFLVGSKRQRLARLLGIFCATFAILFTLLAFGSGNQVSRYQREKNFGRARERQLSHVNGELVRRWWIQAGNTSYSRSWKNIPMLANSPDLQVNPDILRDVDDSFVYCSKAPLYIDFAEATRRAVVAAAHPPPAISIIFVTKRPGGYDILLNSLAQQTRKSPLDYEVICVDELAPFRSELVREQARALGVNLVAIVPSKPRQSRYHSLPFGIYNALNTGFLLSRGRIVTILMDNGWLPPNYIERTLEFYADPSHERSFLAYPEWFFTTDKPEQQRLHDPLTAHLFPDPWLAPPVEYMEGGRMHGKSAITNVRSGYMRPEELVQAWRGGDPKGFVLQNPNAGFWEMSFCTCPWSAIEELNGLEEWLDIGDDCHESNLRLRAHRLGYDLWIDGNTVIQNIWHKFYEDSKTWNRYASDTNIPRFFSEEMPAIQGGKRPVLTLDAQVDWKLWRQLDCPIQVARPGAVLWRA
jgi:glycosyltransferase involved in cell wall biosynthesis